MALKHIIGRCISNPSLGILVVGIISTVMLQGCGSKSSDGEGAAPDVQDNVVATVNGTPIDRDQMYSAMEQYIPAQLPDFPHNQLLAATAGRVALRRLIEDDLTIQLAKINQVPVTDAEVQSRYNDLKMVKEAQSTRSFEDLLADEGMTEDEFKEQDIKPQVAEFNLFSDGLMASNAELLANYNQHVGDYTEPDRVHIERIVLPNEASAQQAYETASKTNSLDDVLEDNIAQPLSGGENTADIAQWLPTGQGAAGYAAVTLAAANAQVGTVIKPVLVEGQWWLVKVDDHRPKEVIPFDQVKNIVDWNVLTAKASAAGSLQKFQNAMEDMTQQAVITVKAPQYISLVKQLKSPVVPAAQAPTQEP